MAGWFRFLFPDVKGCRAIEQLKQATRHPGLRPHYVRYCDAKQAGQLDEALAALDECLGVRENVAGFHVLRAYILGALGRNQEAAHACRRCLELRPRHERASGYLALLLCHIDREEAYQVAGATLEWDPHNGFAAIALALAYGIDGRGAQATHFLHGWLHPDGTLRTEFFRYPRRSLRNLVPLFRATRGLALLQTPDWQLALSDLTEGYAGYDNVEMQHGCVRGIVSHHLAKEDYAGAADWLHRVAALEHSADLAALLSGDWNFAQGRYPQALAAYTSAQEQAVLSRDRQSAEVGLAWTCWAMGDSAAARRHVNTFQDDQGLDIRARLLLDDGHLPAAYAAIQDHVHRQPGDVEAHYLRGLVLRAQGQPELARAAFLQVVQHERDGYLLWAPGRACVRDALEQIAQLNHGSPTRTS